jgi:hypothetical protein
VGWNPAAQWLILAPTSSFKDEQGNALAWLQRVDTVSVNSVHAIVVAPVLVRTEIPRVQRTCDLLITRHSLQVTILGKRPRLENIVRSRQGLIIECGG